MATKGYTDYEPVNGAYPGVSGDFVNEQQNRRGFGVQNVRTVAGEATRKSTSKTLRYVGDKAQSVGKRLETAGSTLQYAPGAVGVAGKTAKYAGRYINRSGKSARVASRALATGRGVSQLSAKTQVGFTMGWTSLLNIISLPIGLLAWAAFGGTAIIASTPGGETLTEVAAWMIGAESINVWVLAGGLFILYEFIILTMFAGAYMQLKLGGLEPLSGKRAALKQTVFLLGFVAAVFLPGSTFIPVILFWLYIVMFYPN
jgi:hypothetical protein